MDLGLYEFWHNLNSRLTIRRELILYAPFFHLRWEILQVIVLLLLGMRWTHVSWKYMYFVSNKRELKKKWTISIGEDNALLTWHLNVLFWYLRKKKKQCKAKGFHCRWFHMHVISRVLCKIHDLRVLYRNSTSRINQ